MTTTSPAAATALAGPPRDLLLSTPFLLKRLGMAVKERSYEAFEGTGVSGQHYAVMLVLEEGARETQGTIADALGYDRSLLVGLLDELEERGFVTRQRDPLDRRRHVVRLTPAGAEAISRLRAISERVEREFLAPLDESEREVLRDVLLKLLSHHDPRCALVRSAAPLTQP